MSALGQKRTFVPQQVGALRPRWRASKCHPLGAVASPSWITSRFRAGAISTWPCRSLFWWARKAARNSMLLTRRKFAIGCGAFASTAFVGARFGFGDPAPVGTHLPIPILIDAAKQENAVNLKVSSGQHAFIEGKPTKTYGYSAPILGPVVRVRRGDEVQVTVENALDAVTTVHWHGLLVPGYNDGGPQHPIKPGNTRRLVLKIDQPSATLWFHPHPHHDTARQTYMGLTGIIIVDDGSDARLDLPRTYGLDDLPIVLQDRSIDSAGSIGYDNNDLNALDIAYGDRGDTIIVNGAITPVAKVPSGLVRLRLLNAANAQNFDLRFKDQRTFHVIASDGGLLSAPVAVTELRISPAERFEVLVDFADGKPVALETGPDDELGVFGRVAPDGSADYVAIMQFEPTPTMPLVKQVPNRLIEPATTNAASATRRRQFVLDSGLCANRQQAGLHTDMPALIGINGKAFDPARIDVETKLGTTEIWEITSIGMAHPFHVHGALFRVLSIEEQPPPAHLAGWKDTVLVEDKAKLLVAFNQRATRQHPFMYHCHILEHEDAGLMGQYICS
jgi:blue copper oxidase